MQRIKKTRWLIMNKEERNKDSEIRVERIDLPISGMTCANCAAKIEKALARVPGVSRSAVNFAAEEATVVFDPDQADIPQLIEKIKDLGYEAKLGKVLLPIQGMTCAACVSRVEKALRALKGVVRVNVNFATERASVEYLPGEVMIEDLKEAVRKAGYTVLEVTEEDLVEKEKRAREWELFRLKSKFMTGAALDSPFSS